MKTTTALIPILLLSACSTVQRETPDLRGQDIRVTLLHTADTHSRLLPYNFVPGRTDQDMGLDPDTCKASLCGEMSAALDDAAKARVALEQARERFGLVSD